MARSVIDSLLLALAISGGGGPPTPPAGAPAAGERPAGTIVFVSDGNRLTAIDVATGRRAARRIRAIPACGAQLFVTGGRVVFSGEVKGRTTVFSLPPALDRRPTRLGAAHAFVPSATDGRVWLAGTDCDRRRMAGVREVAVDGGVTFERDRRVAGSWVVAAVPDALVVYRDRELRTWDPRTGRTGDGLGLEMAFAARGGLLAGCLARSGCEDLAIVDVASGRTVPLPARLEATPAFSHDGSLLAAPARRDHGWEVALVDTRTGRTTTVAGTRTARRYPELSWAPGGRLFIRAGRRVMAHRPGAPRAEALPFRLPRSAAAFAAG